MLWTNVKNDILRIVESCNFDGSDHIWTMAAASTVLIDTSISAILRCQIFFHSISFCQIIMVAPFDFQIT